MISGSRGRPAWTSSRWLLNCAQSPTLKSCPPGSVQDRSSHLHWMGQPGSPAPGRAPWQRPLLCQLKFFTQKLL